MAYRTHEDEARCPTCRVGLHDVLHTIVEDRARLRVRSCPTCAGAWLDLASLRQVVERVSARALVSRIPTASREGDVPPPSAEIRRCPKCQAPMRRYRYGGRPAQVDACLDHGLWLDAGELGEVLEHLAGKSPQPLPEGRIGDMIALRGPRVVEAALDSLDDLARDDRR